MGADDRVRRWTPNQSFIAPRARSPGRLSRMAYVHGQLDDPSCKGSNKREPNPKSTSCMEMDMKNPESNRGRDQVQPKRTVKIKTTLLTIHIYWS